MAKKQATARECSACIGPDGRLGCECLKGNPAIRADLALCQPRMIELMENAERYRIKEPT